MRDNGVHLGRAATPSRTRLKGDPQHIKNPRTSFDHAIPTDERGVPFLGGNLDPLTQKEIGNLGGNFEKKRKELAAGQAHSNTVNHM